MYANRIRSILTKDGLTPDSVARHLAPECDAWFKAEPTAVSFALHSLFREMLSRGWDDLQGVPSEECARVGQELLPKLRVLLGLAPAGSQQQVAAALDSLARAYRDCCEPLP